MKGERSEVDYSLSIPLNKNDLEKLVQMRAGDRVFLSGEIYTGRDAAHKKMFALLTEGKELPFPVAGAFIYYVGPSPAPTGYVIGSAGPTTASRMDAYTPALLDLGVKGLIGKGYRNAEVKNALIRNSAVYFAAIGGAGALLAGHILSSENIAWPELGTEAVRKLIVQDFPVIVAIDSEGNDLYEIGPEAWKKQHKEQ